MNVKIKLLSIFFLVLSFGLFYVKDASANTLFQLSGKVSDSSGTAISGASIDVTDSITSADAGSVTTDSSGNYSLMVIGGTYNVQVTPPAGSNFSPIIALSQTIAIDTVLNFTLVPAGTVTLSGHIYDPLGNPVSNQKITLFPGSINTTTDATGVYSLQVSSGSYLLKISSTNNNTSLNIPQNYELHVDNYPLTQSVILDVTIPAKKGYTCKILQTIR